MIIQVDSQEYVNQLNELFQESLSEAGIRSRTGGLYNSLKVTKLVEGESERFVLSFNDYGVFLDEGVQGRLGGETGKGAGGFNFRFNKSPIKPPTKPPYQGYGLGIKPRPWVARFLAKIEDIILPQMGEEIFLDFDAYVKQQIEGQGTIEIKGKL